MAFVFKPVPPVALDVSGIADRFPVHRIYCIGQNYSLHATEMGATVDRERPLFFMKPVDAIVTADAEGEAVVAYPPGTTNLHHEVEMIVALSSGGSDIAVKDALSCVYGYGIGLDLTRRDLQLEAKQKGRPWDTGKGFDQSAPVSALRRASEIGHPDRGTLSLAVNGDTRQSDDIDQMVFSVAEIIHELSKLFALQPGDLIFSGTPSGVGPLVRGDRFFAELAGVSKLSGRIS